MRPRDIDKPNRARKSFGDWHVEPDRLRLIHSDGTVKTLKPKVMELLLVLLESPGEVIGRQQIMEQVWPRVTVTENSLDQAIADLRRTLGDDALSPKYVQTIARKGFSFIAPVSDIRRRGNSDLLRRKTGAWAIVSAVLIGVVGWILLGGERDDKVLHLVTADGTAGAFVTQIGVNYLVEIDYVDALEQSHGFMIEEPETLVLAWSPDSRFLVYNATQLNQAFFSVNAYDHHLRKTIYFKGPRTGIEDDITDMVNLAERESETVAHQMDYLNNRPILRLEISEGLTLTILLEDDKIRSFAWHTKTSQ